MAGSSAPCRQVMAEQRPILGLEAAVQRDESATLRHPAHLDPKAAFSEGRFRGWPSIGSSCFNNRDL